MYLPIMTQLYILLPVAVLLKIIAFVLKTRRIKEMMPPGPPGLPLLGNIFQLRSLQWLQFTEWSKQYGPIFSLNLAGRPVVVLNDLNTAAEFLDRRSSIYSSRPRFIIVDVLTDGMMFPISPYGDLWRRMRRAAHDGFSCHASATYQHLQEMESALLAFHIVRDPKDWDKHFKRSAASTMLSAIYGWPIDTNSDSHVDRIHGVIHRVTNACLPGAYLVDLFPLMLYFPDWMAKWKREGKAFHEQDTKTFESFLDAVRNKGQAGTSEPCFAAMLLEDEKKYNLTYKETAWLAGTMFGAGSETTATALSVFMLAMVLYPEVMHRAQTQIDAVVGRERLPVLEDRAQLSYIEAIVKEVLRWRPVGPMSIPRCSTQDDWYEGYFIPKDTLLLLNVWAINRHPAHFADCDVFRPERYLNDLGQLVELLPDTHSQGHMSYGSGRRMCVGKDVANQALFIHFATLLWAFDIEKALDADGQPVTPSRTDCIDEGLVVRPVPFECSITPRSAEVVPLLRSVADAYMKNSSA